MRTFSFSLSVVSSAYLSFDWTFWSSLSFTIYINFIFFPAIYLFTIVQYFQLKNCTHQNPEVTSFSIKNESHRIHH